MSKLGIVVRLAAAEFLVLTSLWFFPIAQTAPKPAPAILDQIPLPARVVVMEGKSVAWGTGIVISDKQAITAYHVVDNPGNIWLQFQFSWQMKVTNALPVDDVAVLGVLLPPLLIPTSRLAACSVQVQPGEDVFFYSLSAMGYSVGKVYSVEDGGDATHIWHTAWIQRGDSGAPLYNKDGEVIGMTIAYFISMGPRIGIAVHVRDLWEALGQPCP